MREFKNIKKILVIKLRHIGDVLLTVPTFKALRENFPDAHIAALVELGTEEVLTGNHLINEIITFDRKIKSKNLIQKFYLEMSFFFKIRAMKFDMTVDLTGGDRPAVISLGSGAKYRFANIPGRKRFPNKKYFFTHLSERNSKQHMLLQNLAIVGNFGITTKNLKIDFHIPEKDLTFIKQLFDANNIKSSDTIVHIHPTSRWLFKCWKDEYVANLISRLIKEGIKVIMTSSPDKKEIEKAEKILTFVPSDNNKLSPNLISLCGKTNIKQLGAISRASDLFFGVDSAPMHIAAAIGTPVVALFGPTGDYNWRPWHYSKDAKNPHVVLKRSWDCVPCGQDGCNGTKISNCLEDITPVEVWDLINKKLSEIINQKNK
jgi:heptosyltransferase-3